MQDIIKVLGPVLIANVAILVIVVLVIKRILMGDTKRAVERINQVEADVRKREEGIRREIEEHEKEFAAKKAEAEDELAKHKAQAEKEVGRLKDQITAEARQEGDRIIEQARRNEGKLRQQIAQDMEEKAVEYGAQVFKLVFSERMNEELNRQFIDELLAALDEVDAANITVDADHAEFRASHPLAQEQKSRLEELLQDKFGVQVKVEEMLDESLLAGLVFKLGSLEIDGSLRNRYEEAMAEVKKGAHT